MRPSSAQWINVYGHFQKHFVFGVSYCSMGVWVGEG